MAKDDCLRMEAEISALLDGELAGPDAAAVEAHVRTCPACAVLARDLAAVGRTLRSFDASAPVAPVSPGFRARVLSRVAAERRALRPAPEPRSAPAPVPALRSRFVHLLPAVAAAASFVAVLGVGALLGRVLVVEAPVRGPSGVPVPAPGPEASAPSAGELLASAERHRLQGRSDLQRREVLAAWGISPADPEVRRACISSLGFDPSELPAAAPALPAPGAPRSAANPAGGVAAADADEGPDLLIGSLHFETPGAYDAFVSFRERSEALEMARASRDEALRGDTKTVAAVRREQGAGDPLQAALASLTVGSPVGGEGSPGYQGIIVFSLRSAAAAPAGGAEACPSLPEALETGRARAFENPGRGDSTILVSNLDPARPLLVLAGEILTGGRGDRMVAKDALLPAGAVRVPVAVYSVVSGESASRKTRFDEVAGVAGPRLRSLALGRSGPEDFQRFLRGRLGLLDIAALHGSLAKAYSERGPAAPYLRAVKPQVADLLRGLQGPDVVGFAVAQGQEVLAFEVFGGHELMLREAPRILQGCALEAATCQGGGRPPAKDAVAAMLAAAARGTALRGAAGDPGEIGVMAAECGLLGSGVARSGVLVHASILRGSAAGGAGSRGGKGADGASSSGDKPTTTSGSGGGEGTPPAAGPGPGGGDSSTGASGGSDEKKPDPPSPGGGPPR